MTRSSKHSFELSPKKRALLELLLKEEEMLPLHGEIIPRRKATDALPLSFAQERLWFLAQLEPNSPFYNMPFVMRLFGPLDLAALERGLDELVCRHEALRTTFAAVDGRPVQVITPTVTVSLPVIDLRGLPETRRELEAQSMAAQEAACPFDLTSGPLLRTTLLRLGDVDHI